VIARTPSVSSWIRSARRKACRNGTLNRAALAGGAVLLVSSVTAMSFAAPNAPVALGAHASPDASTAGCVGHVALWGDRIVFESAGDLWTARVPEVLAGETGDATEPIEASRLTSGAGQERWPSISPDGSLVAFVGEYDGNPEAYVMPLRGGTPRRLTFHPGRDIPLGWTPDGSEILIRSQRDNPLGRWELLRVPLDGGAAVRDPMAECSLASIDPASGRLAFTRWSNESWNWRGYRGGTAPDIWIASPDRREFTQLTETDANELFPVWSGGRVVYVSDEHGRAGIVSDRAEGGDRRVLIAGDDPSGFDVRRLSADSKPGTTRIAFSRGCQAGILDTASGAVRMLELQLVGDRVDERERLTDPLAALTAISLAPDGSLAALEARGEILLVPTGDPKPGAAQRWRQIPQRSDARDAGVSWQTPEQFAYQSDQGGNHAVRIATLGIDGGFAERTVAEQSQWIFPPQVSPDGSLLAYADKSLRLHLVDLASRVDRVVATAEAGEISEYRFSPDGRFLAWAEPRRTGLSQIRILSISDGSVETLGDGMTHDAEPRWDPAGKYLYFLSRRHVDPQLDPFELNFINPGSMVICALPLDAKTPPPLRDIAAAAGFDLEEWAAAPEPKEAEAKGDGAKGDGAKSHEPKAGARRDDAPPRDASSKDAGSGAGADSKAISPPVVTFDSSGTARRIVRLPAEPGELESLEAIPGGVLYLRRKAMTLNKDIWPPPMLGMPGAVLHHLDLAAGEDAPLVKEPIAAYAVSRDGSTVLVARDRSLLVIEVGAGPDQEPKALELSGVRVAVDVGAEWAQIFDDAWRLQRDFFWRDDFGGIDWDAVRSKYAALLPRIRTRAELNELIGQMMGELGTSHLYIGGGDDFAKAKPVSVGMLGIDAERRDDVLVITRVLPDLSSSSDHASPLAAPHLGIRPGAALLAINGRRLDPARDYREALVGLGGQKVLVTLADDGRGTNARSVEVTALEDEAPLRYGAWVESNRQRVAERSNGRLGYLHLPDMDADGLTAFVRQFYPQLDREGLVIDVRDNGGGFVSQMIIERLARRIYAWMTPRHGTAETYPQRVMDGPVAVIIDQNAGSDGDIFPESFRLRQLGPLVGTRTWGGVIGIRMDKPFIDGGTVSQPEFAWWEPIRGFALENSGVTPDEVVEITPMDRIAGRDPQLDRTVDLLMEALAKRPATPRPPAPVSIPRAP